MSIRLIRVTATRGLLTVGFKCDLITSHNATTWLLLQSATGIILWSVHSWITCTWSWYFLKMKLQKNWSWFKDWSTPFLFALGNERTLVTCKSYEALLEHLHATQCPFISQCKKKCTSILIFMLKAGPLR